MKLSYEKDGAQLFSGAALSCLGRLKQAVATLPRHKAGIRLTKLNEIADLIASEGIIGGIAARVIESNAKPVRAIFFDKSADTNWSLDWHQDRVICVKERREAPGYGPWTIKDGQTHVAPPFDLLARMVTLRVHLDDVEPDNAPLLIAPGSHRLGRVIESQISEAVAQCGTHACLAQAGDVWLYSTPILHASKPSERPAGRRVLQLDYAALDLPCGLSWQELV